MNRKTLYLNVLAVALLSLAGTAQAAKSMPLADAIRLQARAASANILDDTRASLIEQTRTLDVPGVEAGPIRLVEDAGGRDDGVQASLETAALLEVLREELAVKALEVPGMFGVYRYLSQQALATAIVVAE